MMRFSIPTFVLQIKSKSEIPLKNFDMMIKDGICYMRTDDNSWFWNKCNVKPLELNIIAKRYPIGFSYGQPKKNII